MKISIVNDQQAREILNELSNQSNQVNTLDLPDSIGSFRTGINFPQNNPKFKGCKDCGITRIAPNKIKFIFN
jgi:hypothetical protein